MITRNVPESRFLGLAPLYLAAAYVAMMVFSLVATDYLSVTDPLAKVARLEENQLGVHVMYLVAYVAFGLVLTVLVLGLEGRLAGAARTTSRVAAAVGLIWAALLIASGMITIVGMDSVVELQATDPAAAAAAWQAIEPVALALGGAGAELLGGLWVLLVSVAALRAGALPTWLNWLGVVVGAAGIASTVPGLALAAGLVFGLLQIVWFVGLGVSLLREREAPVGALQAGAAEMVDAR
jgi:hypothetical protein